MSNIGHLDLRSLKSTLAFRLGSVKTTAEGKCRFKCFTAVRKNVVCNICRRTVITAKNFDVYNLKRHLRTGLHKLQESNLRTQERLEVLENAILGGKDLRGLLPRANHGQEHAGDQSEDSEQEVCQDPPAIVAPKLKVQQPVVAVDVADPEEDPDWEAALKLQYPSLETQRKYLGPIHAWVKWRKSNRQVIRK